jgi:hypothetical protein
MPERFPLAAGWAGYDSLRTRSLRMYANPVKEVRIMRCCGSSRARGWWTILALSLALPAAAQGQSTSYLDHEGLTRELRSVVNSSSLATMESLGKTLGGRDIWMVRVAQSSGLPLSERPGILVVGNLEGDHVVGSHLALEAIRYLVGHAGDEDVQAALRDAVFYFFPRLNPDGAEAMFARVKFDRKTNDRPVDDDNDGRVGEDGPRDLNGDGFITVMRVPDPAGPYMIDPDEPRLMKRADPSRGERGSYSIYWEGTDQDGDGFIAEDGPGGVDLNRNFQHEYPYWQADAGPHMVSELETRALMDFTIAHRNVAVILTFGHSDNLVTPPDSRGALAAASFTELPAFAQASNDDVFRQGVVQVAGGFGRGGGGGGFMPGGTTRLRGAQPGRDNDPTSGTRPVTTVATQDLDYFQAISRAYRSATGVESVLTHRTPEGAFFQYGYFHFGVPSFSTPGWTLAAAEAAPRGGEGLQTPTAAPAPGEQATGAPGGARAFTGARGQGTVPAAVQVPSQARAPGGGGADARVLRALDAAGIQAFVDWSSFNHSDLGEVEIGGFRPYAVSNPPAERLPELGAKQGEFLVAVAGMLPRVRIVDTKVTAHGGGIFTVSAEVENGGFLPTSTQHGVRARSVRPTMVQIQVEPDDILTGADKTSFIQRLEGSGSRESFTWVIRGSAGARVEIKLRSDKGGTDTATVTLR